MSMNIFCQNILSKAENKYSETLNKTKSQWHSYCGCEIPGQEDKCNHCPYFIEFLENLQKNLPLNDEYPLIIPLEREDNEETQRLCVEMYGHNYSVDKISKLMGIKSQINIVKYLQLAGIYKTIKQCTQEEKELVLNLYLQGKSVSDVEEETKVSAESLASYLRHKRILRKQKKFKQSDNEKEIQQIISMYKEGFNFNEIEEVTGVSRNLFYKILNKYNLVEKKKVGAPRKYSSEIREECIKMRRQEGKSYVEIESIMNVSTTTIKNWCKQKTET